MPGTSPSSSSMYPCHMQVHSSGKLHPYSDVTSKTYKHDGVTSVSVSTLKPPLRVIGVLPLKLQTSPILSVCI